MSSVNYCDFMILFSMHKMPFLLFFILFSTSFSAPLLCIILQNMRDHVPLLTVLHQLFIFIILVFSSFILRPNFFTSSSRQFSFYIMSSLLCDNKHIHQHSPDPPEHPLGPILFPSYSFWLSSSPHVLPLRK